MLCETFKRIVTNAIILTVVASAMAPAMGDTIIYSDSFARSGSLSGSTPDTRLGQYGGSDAATWSAGAAWTTDGSAATLTDTEAVAGLPFTPEAGHVYTFSATVNTATGDSNWLAMGFSQYAPIEAAYYYGSAVNANGWVLLRHSTDDHTNTSFLSLLNDAVDAGSATGDVDASLILDTTVSNAWTFAVKLNGTTVRSATPYSGSIGYISFGSSGGVIGHVDNVMLSVDPAPEPTALVLMTSGLIGLSAYAWRRRR